MVGLRTEVLWVEVGTPTHSGAEKMKTEYKRSAEIWIDKTSKAASQRQQSTNQNCHVHGQGTKGRIRDAVRTSRLTSSDGPMVVAKVQEGRDTEREEQSDSRFPER